MTTLSQIADRAQVSRHTVARILNGQAKESWPSMARRAQRIRKIAEEMCYRPNAAARATVTGRFGCLALLLSTVRTRSYLPASLLDGIQDELTSRDLALSIAKAHDSCLRSTGFMPRILRQTMSDGLIVDYTDHIPAEMIDAIERHNIPTVWLNAMREDAAIRPDELGGGELAVRELLARGHRHIAYADFTYDVGQFDDAHFSRRLRRDGYLRAMEAAGLAPMTCMKVGDGDERVMDLAGELIARPDRPTAVIVYGGDEAAALLWSAQEAGLRVPDDLSIVVFAGEPYGLVGRRFATVVCPHYDMGRAAVAMVLRAVDQSRRRQPSQLLPYTWSDGVTVTRVANESRS